MNTKTGKMKILLLENLPEEGITDTGIPGVGIFRIDNSFFKRPQLYNPQIIVLAEGKKNIYLGEKRFTYDPTQYYVQTLPLPVECEAVIEEGKPMLGIAINIDPRIIGEILNEAHSDMPAPVKVSSSLYSAPVSDELLDPVIRLLKTLKNSHEVKILGPIFLKEILFRVLTGENGEILREIAYYNRGFYQVSHIINNVHKEYSNTFEIQQLARKAGMSTTAFHAIFKDMTGTTPLQYIKNIRLHKAKEMIQHEREKASIAAMRVGYESSSQFSREYKRTFGTSPAKDRQALAV